MEEMRTLFTLSLIFSSATLLSPGSLHCLFCPLAAAGRLAASQEPGVLQLGGRGVRAGGVNRVDGAVHDHTKGPRCILPQRGHGV